MNETDIATAATFGIFIALIVLVAAHAVQKHRHARYLQKRRDDIEALVEELRMDGEYGNAAHDQCQRYFFLRDLFKII
jgi:hypothetical protein